MKEHNKNIQLQYEQFDRRERPHKLYGQNPKVYNYYNHLNHEKIMREKELERIMID